MSDFWRSWRNDRLLQNVVRSSGYLFSSNTVTVVLSMLQGVLVARLVGMDGLGLITTVTVFVSNINRFMSFRLSEVVVQNLGEALEQHDKERASATIRWSISVELITSLLAFSGMILLSPWAAKILTKDPTNTNLFWLYGLVLIGNFFYETSTGILQTLRHFDRLAIINVVQSLITAGIILYAFITQQGVGLILVGYLVGKVFAGLAVLASALSSINHSLGNGWWSVYSRNPVQTRKMIRFAINTNLHGTVNLFTRDNIPLLLAAMRPQFEVGYYKLALSIINIVMLPIEPFIWPTYTEITRTIANHQWELTRKLLRQVSIISVTWTLLAGGVVVVFGSWLIPLIYGADSSPAYPAFLLLFLGYGFANVFNWNRPLMLAFNKPGFPLIVAVIIGLVELGLVFSLVPRYGYLMQALILSGYLVATIGIVSWRGLKELRLRLMSDSQLNYHLGSRS